MAEQGQHGLAAQQAAAKDYRPCLEGPPIGNKTPISAVVNEYAKADPVYVEKTTGLATTYSHYRPIHGDGNCGWRAIGFSYFEKLIEAADQSTIEGEVARLISMNQMLATVGGYSYFEDWADEMIGLLRHISQNLNNPLLAHMMVMEKWSDPATAGGLIYYLRMLACTYLISNQTKFAPFVASYSTDIHDWCAVYIEPVDTEIEHLGIVALVDILLKPAKISLEISYLDRSAGQQVNKYVFPTEDDGQVYNQNENNHPQTAGSMIYLLYRPDHYDIIYRTPQPMPDPSHSLSLQVNRVSNLSHGVNIQNTQANLNHFSTCDYSLLSVIPSFNPAPSVGGINSYTPPPVASSAPDAYPPMQQNHQWLGSFPEELSAPVSRTVSTAPAMASPQPATPPTPMSANSSMGTGSALVLNSSLNTSNSPVTTSGNSACNIRFSQLQLEYNEGKIHQPEPTFQVTTNTFKNSVWNRAHFGNPDFHPEEWSPDDEHVDGRVGGKKRSRRD